MRRIHPDFFFQVIQKRLLQHLVFWGVLFCLAVLPESGGTPLKTRLSYALIFLSSIAAVVYLHFFLWRRFLARKRYWLYAGCLAAVVAAAAYAESYAMTWLSGSWVSPVGSAASFLFFVVFTSAIRLAKDGLRQRMEVQEIREKQLQTELNLLRAQINPHFLFNTLNNLYAMAQRQDDPSTAAAIARLSHLMRYVVYESDVPRIELSREVEQIRSYIELQKLRFSEEDDIRLSFNVSGDTDGVAVAPMLLLPFVENAFKHGISLQQPSCILIELQVDGKTVLFSVENSIRNSVAEKTEPDSALGLKNVRRRLELIYPDNHHLTFAEAGDRFAVTLRLRL